MWPVKKQNRDKTSSMAAVQRYELWSTAKPLWKPDDNCLIENGARCLYSLETLELGQREKK